MHPHSTCCSVGGCQSPAQTRGYCIAHYRRWLRYGDPAGKYALQAKPGTGCAVEGCTEPLKANGYCFAHNYRFKRYGDPLAGAAPKKEAAPRLPRVAKGQVRRCQVDGCDEPALARNYCRLHYRRFMVHADPSVGRVKSERLCVVPGCGQPHKSRGYCNMHLQRVDRHNDPNVTIRAAAGEGSVNVHGYRVIEAPGHPNANRYGRLYEHRLVMSQLLGRALYPDEVVHHRDGDRLNNRPENLELWIVSHPNGQRVEDLLPWARELLRRYGP